MVTFNELRICEDGNYLIVDCEIDNVDIYKDMYIKNIYVEYYKNASSASMPGAKAYHLYENKRNDSSIKGKRVKMSVNELGSTEFGITSFDGGLFYVIVECDGPARALAQLGDMPCGFDQTVDIGAILDWTVFYRRGMSYIASMFDACGNPCQPTDGFEHFILLWNALKLAIDTCDWEMVKDLWDRFLFTPSTGHMAVITGASAGGCGCGR